MPVRPMLLHRMALVSSRLFCKNLGNLQEFFGQMVYRPPLAENCPYAYGNVCLTFVTFLILMNQKDIYIFMTKDKQRGIR